MKIKIFLLFIISSVISCSDTNVIENKPDESSIAPPIVGYFKKNVLIEDYTGTWCGNCTRVSYSIKKVFEKTDKAVVVAIHNGNDPYHFEGFEPLKDLVSPNYPLALPISRLNRTTVWSAPEYSSIQQVVDLTSNNATLGLAIQSEMVGNNIDLNVNMKFNEDFSDLKLVVYLLENKLIYEQRNYTNFYDAINPIPNYEHNDVLRKAVSNIMGDSVTGTTKNGNITKKYSFQIPSNVSNKNNLSIVAFLVNSKNYALNARAAIVNEKQEFQINK